MLVLPVPDGAVPLSCRSDPETDSERPLGHVTEGLASRGRSFAGFCLTCAHGLRGHLEVKSWASSVMLGVLITFRVAFLYLGESPGLSPIFHEGNKKSSLQFPRDPAGDLGSAGQRWPHERAGAPTVGRVGALPPSALGWGGSRGQCGSPPVGASSWPLEAHLIPPNSNVGGKTDTRLLSPG